MTSTSLVAYDLRPVRPEPGAPLAANLILDDPERRNALSDTLLERDHAFMGPAGTTVMFDGSYGIHRGGQVSNGGTRWAIQIALRAGTPVKRPLWRRAARILKRRLLRMRDVIQGLKTLREIA